MGDVTSAPETGSYITDRREPVNAPYVEYVLICPSDLMAIIEMDIRKNSLPRRITADLSTDITLYGAAGLWRGRAGSYCNLLLVGSGH